MGNESGIDRVPWYFGPDEEISEEDLDRYEEEGGWIAEPKADGIWCMYDVGDPIVMKSRDARTGEVTGKNAGDLREIVFPKSAFNLKLIGELEASTQWAKERYEEQGFRRLHLFDVYVDPIGRDQRKYPWTWRRGFLEGAFKTMSSIVPMFADRFTLVPYVESEFRVWYKRWIEDGYEGLVLKRADSSAISTRKDGKTDLWKRCKKHVTVDYVLCGLAETDGGLYGTPKLTGEWGLYKGGVLVKVLQAGCPDEYLKQENVGKLVAQFMGWHRFKSGSLRHAQFDRVRDDKMPEDCI